jgi:hypothetical protein
MNGVLSGAVWSASIILILGRFVGVVFMDSILDYVEAFLIL